MKHVVIAALLVSTSGIAEETANVEEPAKAEVSTHKDWPTLNELWNDTESGQSLQKAIAGGTPELEFLLGYEYSDLDQVPPDTKAAHGLITRTRLNYQTADYRGFDAFVQAQYVGPINDHYRHQNGGNTDYDSIADPESFRFHQAYLAYTGYDSHVRAGSQEILLDNQRFIGNVGWRLNAQSFNSASIANHSVSNLALYYAYTDSINEINGERNGDRQYHLANAEYKLGESNKASGFVYLQRNDNGGPDRLDTFGLRAWGKNDKIIHDAMFAFQRDAYYGSIFGEMDLDAVDVGAGVEYISGGDNVRDQFQTLNGTGHKFNGWADQFLGTGGGLEAGLIDIYGQISSMPVENLKLMGVYHWFNTAQETAAGFSGQYGQEIDLLAKYPVCKNFDVITKLAYYIKGDDHGNNFTNDETVFWLRGTLTF
jgi:hypothetical protein